MLGGQLTADNAGWYYCVVFLLSFLSLLISLVLRLTSTTRYCNNPRALVVGGVIRSNHTSLVWHLTANNATPGHMPMPTNAKGIEFGCFTMDHRADPGFYKRRGLTWGGQISTYESQVYEGSMEGKGRTGGGWGIFWNETQLNGISLHLVIRVNAQTNIIFVHNWFQFQFYSHICPSQIHVTK